MGCHANVLALAVLSPGLGGELLIESLVIIFERTSIILPIAVSPGMRL